MEQYRVERRFSHLLVTREDHADDPEENNVVTCYQHIGREEVVQILSLLGPAQCRERPQCGGEPGIERIRILLHVTASALRALLGRTLCHNHLTTVRTVVSRDAVSPPELSGDAPVADVIRPVKIGLLHALRQQLDISVLHCLHCRFDQLIHLYKPLLLHHRLYRRTAAVVCSYIMRVRLHLYQKSLLLQVVHQCLSAFVAVHPLVFSCEMVHRRIVVNDGDLL